MSISWGALTQEHFLRRLCTDFLEDGENGLHGKLYRGDTHTRRLQAFLLA